MPLFDDVSDHNDSLVRKALGIIVAVAPYSEAAIADVLDATTGLLKAMPANWKLLGRLTEDGVTFPRETEVSEIYGHGSTDPARSDIRRAKKSASFTLMEARKSGFELAQGVSTITPTASKIPASTGNQQLKWDEPEVPTYPYLRALFIAKDLTGTGEMYIADQALRCKVTEVGETAWSDQDTSMNLPITMTFFNDPVIGSALRHFRAGPGYTSSVITAEGFTPAP
ncbi:MAG: hypothetical protein ACRDQD_00465 [Nocardioidaceae bacterium]